MKIKIGSVHLMVQAIESVDYVPHNHEYGDVIIKTISGRHIDYVTWIGQDSADATIRGLFDRIEEAATLHLE